MPNDNNEAYELKDVQVDTLGLVTHGANREEFFLTKEDASDDQSQTPNFTEMEEKVTKTIWQKLTELFKKGQIEVVEASQDEVIEEAVTEEKQDDTVVKTVEVIVEEKTEKGEDTMPEDVISKAEFEKAQTELAEIRKQLDEAKAEKEQLTWLNKAATFGYAPVASTELGSHLYAIAKLDANQANWLVDLLKSYDSMLADSGMFTEKGTNYVENDVVEKVVKATDVKSAALSLTPKEQETLIAEMRAKARG